MKRIPKTRLGVHIAEIRADLAQLDTVIDDAIALLFAGFTNIAGLIRLQQKTAAQLALVNESREYAARIGAKGAEPPPAAELPAPLLLAQHSVIADQIESQINAIVRSLQFQDLSVQVIAHAAKRLAMLELALDGTAVPEESAAPAEPATPDGGEAAKRPAGSADVIEFPRSRPLTQHGMAAGDVELF
jgi:hypothetical protein